MSLALHGLDLSTRTAEESSVRTEASTKSSASSFSASEGGFGSDVAIFDTADVPIVGKGRTFTHVEMRKLNFHIGKAQVLKGFSANLHQGELL